MLSRDELTPAIRRIWYPQLNALGFRKIRRRDLVREVDGIVQLINFQVSAHGSRMFTVNIAAFLLAANDVWVLQPGFRLPNAETGGALWCPSQTEEQADQSAAQALKVAEYVALPWLQERVTLSGFATHLKHEAWGSLHHLEFQRGVAAALLKHEDEAAIHLVAAARLYREDGRAWCAPLAANCEALLCAIRESSSERLLADWTARNRIALGLRRVN